jgi:hypothetical protein
MTRKLIVVFSADSDAINFKKAADETGYVRIHAHYLGRATVDEVPTQTDHEFSVDVVNTRTGHVHDCAHISCRALLAGPLQCHGLDSSDHVVIQPVT